MLLRLPMRRNALWRVCLAVAGLAASLAICAPAAQPVQTPRTHRTQPSQSDYIDSRMCASCHREIAESYSQTGMGRSFGVPDVNAPRADFNSRTVYNKPSQMYYTMF
ncbi:MAG TPA: hypothetical protein VF730_00550, partial [Terracidiphilus sp.]